MILNCVISVNETIKELNNKVKKNSEVTINEHIEKSNPQLTIIINYFRNFQNSESNLSEKNAFFLSILSFLCIENEFNSVSDIARHLKTNRLNLLKNGIEKVLSELYEQDFISKKHFPYDNLCRYSVKKEIQKSIESDAQFIKINNEKNAESLIELVADITDEMENCDIELDDAIKKIRRYYDMDCDNIFIKKLICDHELSDFEKFYALVAAYLYQTYRKPLHLIDSISKIFKHNLKARNLSKQSFINDTNPLIQKGILIKASDESDHAIFLELTEKSIEEFDMVKVEEKVEVKKKNYPELKYYDLHTLPPLYYNDDVEKQIERLSHILQPDVFNKYMDNLSVQNKSFNIFLYGSSGSGKTSLSVYLSSLTERPIYRCNISDYFSKYFGESEKKIHAKFENYRKMVADNTNAVFLIDEIDALYNNKMTDSSIDFRLRGVLLTEIENLDKGILITTSNFADISPELERRFLFKINVSAPTFETRKKIWKASLPDYNEMFYDEISNFEISGGTIMNLEKKVQLEKIIGGDVNEEIILTWVREEVMFKKNGVSGNIGFRRAS